MLYSKFVSRSTAICLLFSIHIYFAIPPSIAVSSSKDTVISDFIAQAKIYYYQKQHVQAVNELCNAILLEPYNQSIYEALKVVSTSSQLTAKDRMIINGVISLHEQNVSLNREVTALIKKRNLLIRKLEERGLSQRELNDRILKHVGSFELENTLTSQLLAYQKQTDQDRLNIANGFITTQNKLLLQQMDHFGRQFNFIKKLHLAKQYYEGYAPRPEIKEVPYTQMVIYPRSETGENPQKIFSEQIDIREKGEVYDRNLLLVERHISTMHKKMAKLQILLDQQDRNITSLNDQIVDLTLRLTENEVSANQNQNQMTNLSNEIIDLQARLEFGETLIKEKDKRIEELVGLVQRDVGNQQMMVIYQQKLREASLNSTKQAQQLERLKERLFETEARLFAKDTALIKTRDQLTALEGKVDHLEAELEKLKRKLSRGKSVSDINVSYHPKIYSFKKIEDFISHRGEEVRQLKQKSIVQIR